MNVTDAAEPSLKIFVLALFFKPMLFHFQQISHSLFIKFLSKVYILAFFRLTKLT